MRVKSEILFLAGVFLSISTSIFALKLPELPSILTEAGFIGRSLDLYIEMFPADLKKDRDFLENKRILFVPGGPSSVKGELIRDHGANPSDIEMCDLEYPQAGGDHANNMKELEEKIFSPEKKFHMVHKVAALVNWGLVGSAFRLAGIDDFEVRRQNYLRYNELLKVNNQNFLDDYKNNPSWMINGDITKLPPAVTSKQYDLIFSSNLLHLYNHILDKEFHEQAYEELTKILAPGGHLLVFPITNVLGQKHQLIDPMIESLEAKGFKAELVQSDAPIPNDYFKKLLLLPYKKAYYLRIRA